MFLFQFRQTTSISGGIPANVGDWVRLSRSSPSYLSFWRSSSSSLSASSSTSSCRLLPTPCATFYLRDRLAPCYYGLLFIVDKIWVLIGSIGYFFVFHILVVNIFAIWKTKILIKFMKCTHISLSCVLLNLICLYVFMNQKIC